MILIQLQIADRLYAIDVVAVDTVIPALPVREIPHAPPAVVGVFEYRGVIVPVVDLCKLIENKPAVKALSSRFIIVNLTDAVKNATKTPYLLALLGEKVTSTISVADDTLKDTGVHSDDVPYLGPVFRNSAGQLIQCFTVDRILSEEVLACLHHELSKGNC